MSVEIKGDKELIAYLEHADERILPDGKRVVSKGALNIKNDWRRRWRGIAHAPRLPLSISYDLHEDEVSVWADIGPVDGPQLQGFLGPIIEYGGIHNAPQPGGLLSLQVEQPKYEAAIDALVAKLYP